MYWHVRISKKTSSLSKSRETLSGSGVTCPVAYSSKPAGQSILNSPESASASWRTRKDPTFVICQIVGLWHETEITAQIKGISLPISGTQQSNYIAYSQSIKLRTLLLKPVSKYEIMKALRLSIVTPVAIKLCKQLQLISNRKAIIITSLNNDWNWLHQIYVIAPYTIIHGPM